jgi:hypothetical protein
MPSKVTRKNSRLADDMSESLREATNYVSGKPKMAIVHRSFQMRPKHAKRG